MPPVWEMATTQRSGSWEPSVKAPMSWPITIIAGKQASLLT